MRYSQLEINANNTSPLDFVRWMQDEGLLHRGDCPTCHVTMRVQAWAGMVGDGVCNKCPVCALRLSVRNGSWFAGFRHLSLVQCVRLLVAYEANASISSTAKEWRISPKTVSLYYNEFRQLICAKVDDMIAQDPRPFLGDTVEIDCATFKHIKDTVNNIVIPVLHVQGIYEYGQSNFRWQIVQDQSAASLRPPIRRLVPRGSVIVTDEHKSYQTLHQDDFNHFALNHKAKIYASTEVHPAGFLFRATTNHLESLWAGLRARIRNPQQRTLLRLKSALKEILFAMSDVTIWDLISV